MAKSWSSSDSIQGSDFNVAAQFRTREANRGERAVAGNIFGMSGIGYGTDVVGINVNYVPTMQNQIRESVKSLQAKIDEIDANTNQDKAFKSEEIQKAVREYIEKVKDYCKALISDLNAFNDKLQSVREAWEQSSARFASEQINSDAGSFSSSTTQYSEQNSSSGGSAGEFIGPKQFPGA